MLLFLLAPGLTNPTSAPSLPPEVDESVLREALRERGLVDWLEQYEADTVAPDEADRTLRERERLLAEAARQGSSAARRETALRAGALLESVIARHPQDPRMPRWRMERARDFLERQEPDVFDGLLLYELPGAGCDRARTLAAQAERELLLSREAVARAWGSLEALDEAALTRLRTAAPVRQLQEIDQQSLMLLAWARLYRVLTEPDASRGRSDAGALLDEALTAGWTQPRAGQEARRCSALILAAISARTAGRFEEADRFAREIVGLPNPASPAGASLRQASLIAVLEQVRVMRDARRLNEALIAARQAGEWVRRTRASEPPALIAAALLECSVLDRQQRPATSPSGGMMLRAAVLSPLAALAAGKPSLRDDLYRTLAGVPVEPAGLNDAFVLQLQAGSLIHEARQGGTLSVEGQERLRSAIKQVQAKLRAAVDPRSAENAAELAFLCGHGLLLLGDFAGSVAAMSQISQQWPQDIRAESAAQATVSIARDWLAAAQDADRAAARDAFVRAVRMWRARSPDAEAVRRLQFFLAAQIEQGGQPAEAAAEYARVARSDPNHVRACVGRARCLRTMIPPAATQPAASLPASGVPHLHEALAVSREALDAALTAQPRDDCLAAEAAVGLARLANDGRANQAAEAVDALDRANKAIQACPSAQAAALREKLEALRQLARWEALVPVFTAYLRHEPDAAGPAGEILLESIRRAVLHALDSGDDAAIRGAAEPGAELARILVSGGAGSASTMHADARMSLDLTRAWLLVHAGGAPQALVVYDRCREALAAGANAEQALRCDLGRAECLLALNRAVAAATLYGELIGRLPEHSPAWWEAFVGTLRCQEQLRADRTDLIKAIQQQRRIAPDLGGPRWRRAIEQIERAGKSP